MVNVSVKRFAIIVIAKIINCYVGNAYIFRDGLPNLLLQKLQTLTLETHVFFVKNWRRCHFKNYKLLRWKCMYFSVKFTIFVIEKNTKFYFGNAYIFLENLQKLLLQKLQTVTLETHRIFAKVCSFCYWKNYKLLLWKRIYFSRWFAEVVTAKIQTFTLKMYIFHTFKPHTQHKHIRLHIQFQKKKWITLKEIHWKHG